MNILTHFGEASALIDGKEYLVRSSFKALAAVGTPEDLELCINDVCAAYYILTEQKTLPRADLISACANLLEYCSDIPGRWLGYLDVGPVSGKMIYRQNRIPVEEIIIMAHHCIRWGVAGDPKRQREPEKKKPSARKEYFDPAEFVSIMIDEFHMSRDDAWNATMTEFQRLCEHRQRKAWGDKPPPPTKAEALASFDYARDAIERAKTMGIKRKKGRK